MIRYILVEQASESLWGFGSLLLRSLDMYRTFARAIFAQIGESPTSSRLDQCYLHGPCSFEDVFPDKGAV